MRRPLSIPCTLRKGLHALAAAQSVTIKPLLSSVAATAHAVIVSVPGCSKCFYASFVALMAMAMRESATFIFKQHRNVQNVPLTYLPTELCRS